MTTTILAAAIGCVAASASAQPGACPQDSLFAQPVAPPNGSERIGLSEASRNIRRAERFTGAAGQITGVTWFGVEIGLSGGNLISCSESNPEFDVIFYQDGGSAPGVVACSHTLTATRTPTGIMYQSNREMIRYSVTLPSPCTLVNGWVSIVGRGDPNCWFFWLSSAPMDGGHYCNGCSGMNEYNFDLSFCLTGTPGGVFGACCNEFTGVCTNNVEVTNCRETHQRFAANMTCAQLSPACAAVAGACCFNNNTCSLMRQSACTAAGGTWRGLGQPCTTCPLYPRCDDNSLFHQLPLEPQFEPSFYTSENGANLHRAEDFRGVAGAISSVRFWGVELRRVGNAWVICTEGDTTFQVTFSEDFGGVPGAQVCSYVLTATRTPTHIFYGNEDSPAELKEYNIDLPTPCAITRGWVSIVGMGDNSCWFLWASAPGPGTSYCDHCSPGDQPNLAICLRGTVGGVAGACCDDVHSTCTDGVDISNCVAGGLRFTPNTMCQNLPVACGAYNGACCHNDGTPCTIEFEMNCDAIGGDWHGPGTACGECPLVGACCQGANDSGASACIVLPQADCLFERHTWLGPGTVCGECPSLPNCPTGVLISQRPPDPLTEPSFTVSEVGRGTQLFEHVSNVSGPIQGLTWWGLDLFFNAAQNLWNECDEPDPTFVITFHQDGGGVPGSVICSYTLTATRTPQNIRYPGSHITVGAELIEFHVDLPAPCVMTNGWISLVGAGDPNCWFLWAPSSTPGDHSSYCQGCAEMSLSSDLSICVHGTTGGAVGACCNDVTGLCAENVSITNCLAPTQRFVQNAACASLNPPCGVVLGACCKNDATCSIMTQADCSALSGNWLGGNSSCDRCPCLVPCPGNAIAEGEQVCDENYLDHFNGGCFSEPPVFSPIVFGQTVCGISGVTDHSLDYDWYEVNVTETTELIFTVEAEFEAAVFVIDGRNGCENAQVLDSSADNPCSPIQVGAIASEGTYWLVVRPLAFTDLAACGAKYIATLEDTSFCAGLFRGDFNGNHRIDVGDLSPLVTVLLNGGNEIETCLADVNGDVRANGLDIQAFLALLLAPPAQGACCLSPDGAGCIATTQIECGADHDGVYIGDGTTCATAGCGGFPFSVDHAFFSLNPVPNCPSSTVEIQIQGSGFQAGAEVRLMRAGEVDIVASGTTVFPDGTIITNAIVDVSGADVGAWRVLVLNPDHGYAFGPEMLNIAACP